MYAIFENISFDHSWTVDFVTVTKLLYDDAKCDQQWIWNSWNSNHQRTKFYKKLFWHIYYSRFIANNQRSAYVSIRARFVDSNPSVKPSPG